jgi:hypothetical protein
MQRRHGIAKSSPLSETSAMETMRGGAPPAGP